MNEPNKVLQKEALVYVTRDIERANACAEKGYYIITNSTDFARGQAKQNPNIFLISENKILDTNELLQHPQTKNFFNKLKFFKIVVFKNTPLIEDLCNKENWSLLNPPSRISQKVEEKISQIEWLGEIKEYLPKYNVLIGKELEWNGNKFIIQFNRSHSGAGTLLIDSKEKMEKIKADFPNRPIRVSNYISGPTLTNNNVVWRDKILVGDISYQITGIKPFTNNQFTTVGNDWDLPKQILSSEQKNEYKKIATAVGEKLLDDGWKGLFGIDVVLEEKTGKLYLLEVNARQPASTTYESILQKTSGAEFTTFSSHLSSLLDLPISIDSLPTVSGAQIIKRITDSDEVKQKTIDSLNNLNVSFIIYPNKDREKELLRIHSEKGIMSAHGKFNELGEKIAEIFI